MLKTNWLWLLVAMLVSGVSCGKKSKIRDHVDQVEAQAQTAQPVAAEVVPVSLPADPTMPTWLVVVEPFTMGASGVISGTGGQVINPGEQIGPGVAAQLVSALQRVGNVVTLDRTFYERDPERVRSMLKENERGPLLVRGTVTEFAETSEFGSQGEGSSNVAWGLVPYAGPLIRFGKGSKLKQETCRTGMVGLDIQVVDPTSGRLVTSFTSHGTFSSIGTVTVRTKWGKTKTNVEHGASAIGQATRAALNDAVTKIHAALLRQPLVARAEVVPPALISSPVMTPPVGKPPP